jgi:hypothetical protein
MLYDEVAISISVYSASFSPIAKSARAGFSTVYGER